MPRSGPAVASACSGNGACGKCLNDHPEGRRKPLNLLRPRGSGSRQEWRRGGSAAWLPVRGARSDGSPHHTRGTGETRRRNRPRLAPLLGLADSWPGNRGLWPWSWSIRPSISPALPRVEATYRELAEGQDGDPGAPGLARKWWGCSSGGSSAPPRRPASCSFSTDSAMTAGAPVPP